MSLEIDYIREVDQLPIGEEAQRVEQSERLHNVIDAMADIALDIATDPKSTIEEGLKAEFLYRKLSGSVVSTETPNVHFEVDDNVSKLATAMAEKYSTEDRSLRADDFSVVEYMRKVDNGGDTQTVPTKALIFNNPRGLRFYDLIEKDIDLSRRSGFEEVFPEAKHTIELGERTFDARTAMTTELYKAFVAKEKELDHPLPDSVQSKTGHSKKTMTTLTGETDIIKRTGETRIIEVAISKDGGYKTPVRRCSILPTWGYRDTVRFRPAIILE